MNLVWLLETLHNIYELKFESFLKKYLTFIAFTQKHDQCCFHRSHFLLA